MLKLYSHQIKALDKTAGLKDNEYWDIECEYINADDEQTKYIKVTYVIKTFE
ncbi:hypothetical protein KQI85_01860 [Falcatimonas sp. MSJ-15]|uniref:hypothetical protein n=1 Tax=Falcatimonas sp. MSJ-15 TaxID=2841515 RepID=UPI001C0FD1E3|nr:hypothetical protein [Falcatimonas sp. MSJ-15]MBU5469119.1 hypothetical protein [Falcatimonas sp. MSJ-15]